MSRTPCPNGWLTHAKKLLPLQQGKLGRRYGKVFPDKSSRFASTLTGHSLFAYTYLLAMRIYLWPSFSNTCACGTFRSCPMLIDADSISKHFFTHCRIQVALSALTCRFPPFESWKIPCGLLGDVPWFFVRHTRRDSECHFGSGDA